MSQPWLHKLQSTDSQFNLLLPKCSDDSYPHVMLRLNYAASMASIHLVVLLKLKEIDPVNYEVYFKDKCFEYIETLSALIPLATAYRLE